MAGTVVRVDGHRGGLRVHITSADLCVVVHGPQKRATSQIAKPQVMIHSKTVYRGLQKKRLYVTVLTDYGIFARFIIVVKLMWLTFR